MLYEVITVADLLIDFKKRSSKNVAAAFVGGQLVEEARAKMQKMEF